MKHRLLSLLFACCMAAAGYSAITYPLNESFESGIPSTWTQEVLSATTQMWIADTNNDYPAGAADGNGRVAFRNTTGESQGYVTRLITPAMDLSGVSSPQLTFAYAQPSRSGANDQLKVYYRLTSTSEWVLLRSYEEAKASWTRDTIDLIATSQGTEYQLAFEGIENGGFDRGVVLDDVKVSPESQCSAAPTGLTVVPDATTAVISWSRINDGRTYEVIVSTSAIADLDNYDVSGAVFHQSGISGRNVTATGLTAQNHYYAYLRSTCDDNESGYSAWTSAVEFDTPCEALTSLQEGFETMEKGSYASEAPECWNILNANTGSSYTYPQIYVNDNSTYVHAGSKSLYFISSSTTYCYAILPALADVSNKQIEFYYKDENASSSGRLFIGYMTDIAEESSFIEIEEFIRSTSWTKGTADFSMAPDGARIAFKYGGASNNYYMGIDDIVISNLPDCRKVSSLNVSNVAGTSAVVNFATFTAAQNYQVVVATEALTLSGDPTEAQLAKIVYNQSDITASGVNVEGLTPATTYYVYARALCGGEEAGEWSTGVSFATQCDVISTFPWTEDFEKYAGSSESYASSIGAYPFSAPCWVNEHISGSGSYLFSVYAGSSKQLTLPDMTAGTLTKLVLPAMSLDAANAYAFSLEINRNASGTSYPAEGIRVYASSTQNIEGATELAFISRNCSVANDTIPAESTTGWYKYELTIPLSGEVYIILRGESKYGNSTYMDNFKVRKLPTCKDIASVAVSAVTNSGAKVVFGNTGAANYQVIVATESVADPETLDASKIVFDDATLTDTIGDVTGLTANTAYFAYVRGVCGSEDKGAWTDAVSFTTACDPIVIASKDEPWTEDFESYNASSSPAYSATYKFNAECWNHQLINGSYYFHVYKPNSGTNTTKQLCSKEASGLKVLLALPSMHFEEANAYAFSFDMNRTGTYTSYVDSLYIYANTSAALDGSEVLLAAIPRVYSNAGVNVPAESEAGWRNYEFVIPIAGNGNIILYVSSKNGDPILIDNLKVRKLPDCRDMGAVAIKSVKTHGATIEFPANGAAQYQIVLATESIDPTYVDSTNVPTSIIYNQLVSSASNIIEDAAIAANSDIYVYVRAYCGAEEQGKWSKEVSFHTLCEPYTIDEFGLENFENKDRINCWTLGFNTEGTSASYAYAQRDSSAAYGAYLRLSKENAADTYNDGAYAITPELNVADITLYEVSFSAATTNNSNAKNLKRVLVGVTTNPSDPNMMQTLKSFNLDYASDSSALKDYTVSLADAEEDEDGNKPRYVFFMAAEPAASHDSANYVLIDNVTFALRSSCAQVIETSVTNLTTDGASISWENVGTDSYQVLVAEVNSKEPDTLVALSSEIVNTNAATIGGLQSNSTYYAYVRGICGVGDTAKWSNAIAFHTTIGIPYLEPFSAATLNEGWKVYKYQSSADSVNIANMSLPASSDAKWVMTTSNVPTGMAGNIAQFRFPYTSGTYYANSWLISPTIDLAGHEDDFIELTFKMAGSNLYTSGTIAVYVSKDDAQSFKKLTTISASDLSATAADFKLKLTKFAGQKINIAFYVYQYYDYSTPRVLSLDSVSVHTYDAVCMGVENLNVALNGLAIDASWTIEGTPAKTIVELSDDATFATFIDSVVVEDAFTHQFSDLQLSKTYYVRAKQADCANAKWVVSNAIKTPIGVPYSESFNVSSIPSDWSKMEGAPASAFAGTAPTATTSGWAISSSSYGLPANHVKINIYDSGSNKWLVSPAIDMTSIQVTDSVVLSFDFAYTDWNSASGPDAGSDQALLLLVSTDGGTTWSAANGYEWSHTDSIVANVSKTLASIPTTGTTITLTDFARFAGHSIKFAFVATTTSGDNDFHIANVSLKQIIANCDDPTELAVEGGSRQIAVTWDGDTNKSSIIQWSKTSDFASLKADTIESGLAYTIESLDPGATYYVRVQQVCAGGNTDFTAVQSASTDCEVISEFPWNEDFSSFANGTLVNPCWKNQHTLGTAKDLFSIGETAHGDNSTKQLYLPDQQTNNRTLLSLSEMTISEADAYAFKLDVYRQSSSKTKEGIVIYASQSDTIDASAVRLAHIIRAYNLGNDTVPAETAAGWYTYEFAIPMSGAVRILLEGISEYGNPTYMDNFQVYRMPTCRQVKNVAVDSIGNDTALVMFDTLKVTVPYEVLVATAEIDFTKALAAADSAKIVIDDKNVTASPAVIRNLVPGAYYYVYVRALCSEEEQGEWSKAASFRTIPTCDDMKAPKSVEKSGNSVTIAFTKTNAANYQLLATLAAINPDTLANVADSIIAYNQVVSEDTVEIAGLQPLTNYYVYVRGVCAADDMGAWTASLKVKTACGVINIFPWKEDFESYTSGIFRNECWINEHISGSGTSTFSIYTYSNGTNSTKQLYLPDMSDGTLTKLVLPVFAIDEAEGYAFGLDIYRNATSYAKEGIRVYASLSEEIDASAVELAFISRNYSVANDTIPAESASGWYTYEMNIPLSGNVYIILRGESKYGSSTYMDNFKVRKLPACRDLKGLDVKEISSSSAKATWKPTNAGQYQVILAKDSINPSYVDSVSGIDAAKLVRIDTVAVTSFDYTALTPSTDYYIYVRGLCSDEDKSGWGSASFTTGCYVTVPYAMDFDDAEDRKVSYSSYKIPSCFNSIAGGSGNPARIYDEDEENSSYYTYSYAHSGTSSLRLYSYSTAPQYVTLPEMNQRTDTLALTFKARALYAYVYTSSGNKTVTNYASSSYAHALKIGTMTDPMDTASFQLIEKVELNEIATTPSSESDDPAGNNYWENFTVYLTGATGKFIAFVSDFSATNYVWIDDVRVDFMPDCRVPAQINITPDKHTADIEWVGSADEYELAIGAQGFNLPGGEADSIYTLDTTFLHAEGLTANTAYDVYIRSACDEGLYSAWSKVTTFRTDCDVFALPFSENFNALESGIPSCWDNSEGTTTTESYKWNYYVDSPDTCLRFNSYSNSKGNTNILATPAIVLSDDAYLSFRFKNPAGDSAQVFIGKAGEAQRDTLQKCIKSLSSWTDYKFDLSKYTGDTVQIYFKGKSNWGSGDAYIYLDDVKVTLYPACRDIETIDVLNVTNVSAAASWTKTKALQYQVILADSAITPAYIDGDSLDMTKVVLIDTVNVNNIEFSGLTAQTTYYIYLRGLCANEEQSAWTTARSFTTECDPLTITANSPWSEGFEDYNGAVYNARGVVPDCWSASATGTYAPHVIGSGSYYYTHEGTKALTFYGSGNCYAVLPAFTNALNTLKIEFYMQAQNASYGTLSLGYITAEDDNMSTFTVIDTYESVAGQMALRETELDEVPANATHLVFRWYYSSQYSCCIDDVTLKFMPACKRVRRLEVLDIATDTAVVSFANSGAANYELVVANAAINPDSVATSDVAAHVVLHNVALADTAAVIRSLNASSEYFVYVRGLCDEGEHSEAWTSTSFITACGVISTFPWTDDLERYATGTFEGLCWSCERIAGEYDFSITNTSETTGNATNKLYIKYQYVGSSAGGTTATAVATLPVVRIDSANAYGVSLDMYRADDSYGDIEGVRILASLSSVLDNSAVELGYICRHYDKAITGSVPAESAAGWYTYEFAIPLKGEVYIFVRAEQEYDANSFFMDNFRVRQLPICGKVTGMEASDITASSATISFPATSATSYHVIVASAALDLTKALSAADSAKIVFDETLTDTVAEVAALTANTLYYAYARGLCDDEDSEWSTAMLFRTECASISLPYSQNFDNTSDRKQIEGTSYYLPLCWNEGHSSTSAMSRIYTGGYDEYYNQYVYAKSGYSALGVVSDASNASYAVLPLIETNGENGVELSFEARALYSSEWYDYDWGYYEDVNNYATSSYAHSIKIGLMSDPSDLSTFSLVEEVTLTELASTPSSVSDDPNGREYWENHTVRLNAPAGKYIAFVSDYSKANRVWIDDIQAIEFNASCQGVDSLEVSNVSISGFDVAFHYNVADDDNDARIAISASETLDLDNVLLLDTIYNDSVYSAGVTLASGRPYYVFVQQFCGEDGASAWEMVETKTPYMVRYEPVFTSTTIPSDWNRYTGLVDNVLAGTTNLASTTSGWYLTPANAIINSTHFYGDIYGGSFNYWVVTPTIDLTPNVGEGLLLSFEAGLTPYSSSYVDVRNDGTDDRFAVLVTTDNGATWTKVAEWNNSGTGDYVYNDVPEEGAAYRLNLSNFAGQNIRIAFYGESTESNADNYFHFGNIVLDKCVAKTYIDHICAGDDYDGSQAAEPNPFHVTADKYHVGLNTFSEFHPSTGAGDADSMIILNLYVYDYFITDLYATVCEGSHYGPDENGFEFDAELGMADKRKILPSSIGCDSTIILHITVNQAIIVHVYDSVEQGLAYEWNGKEYYTTGTYQFTTESEVTGCDSTTVLHLSVYQSEEAIPGVQAQSLLIAPNPVKAGEPIQVLTSFTADELANAHIEIVSATGALVYVQHGADEPFILPGLPISGVYVVRIRIDDAIYISSLLVK